MTMLEKEQKIDEINKKLSAMGSEELLIVHTTIMTLYIRQQFDQCNQSKPDKASEQAAEQCRLLRNSPYLSYLFINS